jgi:Tfp pilus assembly protein PilN
MSEINLVKSMNPQRQEALNRWFKISIIFIVIFLLLLLLITSFQIKKFFSIKQEHQSAQRTIQHVESDLKKQEAIKKEEKTLNQQQMKIAHFKNNPKNPSIYLKELSAIIPADVSLTNYKQSFDKVIELEGTTLQTASITSFLNELKQSSLFETMQLISLQHLKEDNNNLVLLRFIIKGRMH